MIELENENVLTLTEAAARLPRRRAGKRPHVATLYRWALHGLHGVKLETLQIGGTMCTSLEAVQRFCEALTTRDATHQPPASGRRAEQIRRASERLRSQTS